MKFIKPLFFFAGMVFVILACGVGDDPSTAPPVNTLVETVAVSPSVIPRRAHTPISTPTFLSPTAEPLIFPGWVTDFSDPILAALNGQKPDIQDAFINFDQGWFYFIPDSPKGPYYAHIQDEALLLQLPAENEKKDYWVYNPKLARRNFVLSFELQFLESQPEDTFRFQFDQTVDQNVMFDLSKNQTWALHWSPLAGRQATTGTYTHFPPDPIFILVIAKGEECAVYLDNVPLAYLADCRVEPVIRSSPWAMTFHMMAEPGHIAAAAIDNLKLWDLDKIPNLP